MIDAIMYAVRDRVRASGFGYGAAECEIMDDGRPPPRCGSVFVSVHGGEDRSTDDNNLMEYVDFKATLTMRVTVPLDRVGDQQIHRNVSRVPLGEREGFRAKVDQLRRLLHMNWDLVCTTGQTPPSANDNITAWTSGTVYGFVEPARYRGATRARLEGSEWLGDDPDSEGSCLVSELSFSGARRMQPQTLSVGPYI